MAQAEQPEERTKMKLTLTAILMLSLYVSPAFSQEQTGSSAVPLTTTVGPKPLVGQQPQVSSALFPPGDQLHPGPSCDRMHPTAPIFGDLVDRGKPHTTSFFFLAAER